MLWRNNSDADQLLFPDTWKCWGAASVVKMERLQHIAPCSLMLLKYFLSSIHIKIYFVNFLKSFLLFSSSPNLLMLSISDSLQFALVLSLLLHRLVYLFHLFKKLKGSPDPFRKTIWSLMVVEKGERSCNVTLTLALRPDIIGKKFLIAKSLHTFPCI